MEAIKKFFKGEEGQGLAEYALILVLVAVVVIVAIPAFATAIAQAFTDIAAAL